MRTAFPLAVLMTPSAIVPTMAAETARCAAIIVVAVHRTRDFWAGDAAVALIVRAATGIVPHGLDGTVLADLLESPSPDHVSARGEASRQLASHRNAFRGQSERESGQLS
jgi:hypothetical protein